MVARMNPNLPMILGERTFATRSWRRAPGWRAPGERTPDQSGPEGSVPERRVPVQRVPDRRAGEQIGLFQPRKLLHDAGLSDNEREATFSIQRNITRDQLSSHSPRSAQIEGCLRTVGL